MFSIRTGYGYVNKSSCASWRRRTGGSSHTDVRTEASIQGVHLSTASIFAILALVEEFPIIFEGSGGCRWTRRRISRAMFRCCTAPTPLQKQPVDIRMRAIEHLLTITEQKAEQAGQSHLWIACATSTNSSVSIAIDASRNDVPLTKSMVRDLSALAPGHLIKMIFNPSREICLGPALTSCSCSWSLLYMVEMCSIEVYSWSCTAAFWLLTMGFLPLLFSFHPQVEASLWSWSCCSCSWSLLYGRDVLDTIEVYSWSCTAVFWLLTMGFLPLLFSLHLQVERHPCDHGLDYNRAPTEHNRYCTKWNAGCGNELIKNPNIHITAPEI
jgi:hypothetical protein